METFKDYDKRGVRPFVKYSDSGTYSIECYRKKLPNEVQSDADWRMIRIGHIQTYMTREEAEQKVLELAESICKEFNF